MEMQNPYRAPSTETPAPPVLPMSARLAPDERVAAADVLDKPVFFAPSTFKLGAMSLATLGLYTIYWFWRNWQAIQRETGEALWPWARALFCPLWSFSCFSRLSDMTRGRRRSLAFPVAALGIAFFLLNLAGRMNNGGSLLALLSFMPLLPVNALLRQYHRDERIDSTRMDRLTIWHILILVLGGAVVLLAVFGVGLREVRL